MAFTNTTWKPKETTSISISSRTQTTYLGISYERLHLMQKRATPESMMKYKLAIQLYNNFNDKRGGETWMSLNFQQNFGPRNECILISDKSRHKIGRNILVNRLNILNGKVNYDWMNLSKDAFKLKCKNKFLNN